MCCPISWFPTVLLKIASMCLNSPPPREGTGVEKTKTIAKTRLNLENMLDSNREVVIMEQPWESRIVRATDWLLVQLSSLILIIQNERQKSYCVARNAEEGKTPLLLHHWQPQDSVLFVVVVVVLKCCFETIRPL